jgi:hypothetical protein
MICFHRFSPTLIWNLARAKNETKQLAPARTGDSEHCMDLPGPDMESFVGKSGTTVPPNVMFDVPPPKKRKRHKWGYPPVSDPVGKTRNPPLSGIGKHWQPPKR